MPPVKQNPIHRLKKAEKKKVTLNTLDAENKEVDFETLVREEYMRLHRTYRLMEDVRRTIAEQGNKISLRGKLLGLLREQKEYIRVDVVNATSTTFMLRDKKTIITILGILEEFEDCMYDISVCVKNIIEMEENVDKITKRLIEQKLKVQAMYGRSMTVPQSDHKRMVLENRLFQVVTKFDQILALNRDMREEINLMLKERSLFHYRTIAIKRISNRIKSGMGEVVYLATQAYEQRDDLVTKMHAIRERNDKESKQHVLEIKEFNRVLHHDSKLHGFMITKNQNRVLLESTTEREERKKQTKLTELNNTLKAYERSFAEIISMDDKGLTSEELVVEYLENEQINFANFRCLTDLNNEISVLRHSTEELGKEIEEMYQNSKISEVSRKKELEKLVNLYEIKNVELDKIIDIWEASEISMEEFVRLLDTVFSAAQCENSSIIRLLGNVNGISPRNALLCMKVIENRVNELMFDKHQYEVRKAVEINNANLPKMGKTNLTQGPKSKHFGGPFSPQLLITGRLDGDDEEEMERASRLRPYEFEEIRYHILDKQRHLKIPGVDFSTTDVSSSNIRQSILSMMK